MIQTVWVYPEGNIMIVKRYPYSYHIPKMDLYGNIEYEIKNGVSMPLPQWDWVQMYQGLKLAGFQGRIYEISDLD